MSLSDTPAYPYVAFILPDVLPPTHRNGSLV